MTAAVLQILPKRKGRQRPDDGRELLTLFPRQKGSRSFVYAMAFEGGVIKIGQSKTPRQRLLTHWKATQGEVRWIHLFESMHTDTAYRVERALPEALKHVGKQINGSEWFFAEDKAEVLRVVRKVIFDTKERVRADWSERDEERDSVKAVTEFMRANGLIRKEARP